MYTKAKTNYYSFITCVNILQKLTWSLNFAAFKDYAIKLDLFFYFEIMILKELYI